MFLQCHTKHTAHFYIKPARLLILYSIKIILTTSILIHAPFPFLVYNPLQPFFSPHSTEHSTLVETLIQSPLKSAKKMGEVAFPSGFSNGNGNGNGLVGGQRKSCWYEEEIDKDLRWCFALNR